MATLTGTAGNDNLRGTGADDVMDLLAGDDVAFGNGGDDRIFGGDGRDHIFGDFGPPGQGRDALFGGLRADRLYGGVRIDTLYGGAGRDWLDGGDHSDLLYGGGGVDRFDTSLDTSGPRPDLMDGGTGDDILRFDPIIVPIADVRVVVGAAGIVGIGGEIVARLVSVERADVRTGGGDDVLVGGDLNDRLESSGGTDRIVAGGGDDRVTIGNVAGAFADGGTGTDHLVVKHFPQAVTAFVNAAGTFTAAGGLVARNFEHLHVRGSLLGDSIAGGSGSDTIDGRNGDDILRGRGGDDVLISSRGGDLLFGGDGDDVLVAELGQQILHGGAGADSFVFAGSSASDRRESQGDRIHGFETGIDSIDLTDAFFFATPLTFVDAFTGAGFEVTIASESANRHLVLLDRDGDSRADIVIVILGDAPVEGDLIL